MNLCDIKIELFCEKAPKSCEVGHLILLHCALVGFTMGFPACTGKGGTIIWGRKFEDEFSEHLKVSQCPGCGVAMANNGPNTNASQSYFTYAKQPHMEIIDGLETLHELEKLAVNEKIFRPLNDVHIKEVI
uniref:peptidylprolyl isomerase n=1 Tax=Sinocyclocheilus anshuiensis TaxID=1608454 RepID=A0A671MCW6_9TELE